MAGEKDRRPTPRGRAPKAAGRARRAPAPRTAQAPAPRARAKAPVTARRSGPQLAGPGRAAAKPQRPRDRRVRHQRAGMLRVAALVAAGLLALALVAVVALFALRNSPVFAITSIEFEPTEHVSAEDVQSLAQVPEGATLLNVDTDAIEESLRKNPWVASASFSRSFPGTLVISVEEQRPAMLVLMSSGTVAWYLSEQNTWIEPVSVEAAEGQSVSDAALALAQQAGCLLVTDVPSTVDPAPGSAATDAVLDAVRQFQEGFSDDFAAQVACYSAPSTENVSCVLESGVEVSLGEPTDISEKERIVEGYLAQSDGHVVRINVRVPSSPAYRELDSDNVQPGDGVGAAQTSGE
ncbi:FtsQ-type POTRA domain-containing protein [Olsenella uli]|uniref:cell division protein FtsQ/DivIB n=1 Tax=Olsenella uli TaxID=133926 RepID=UPI0019562FAC|nr:FtsQ-type POTRA domain-containing protein [Olsenella uli]MBM6676840.1 FtsQ-type POTRA domain-containing protein [Olsenella uli]